MFTKISSFFLLLTQLWCSEVIAPPKGYKLEAKLTQEKLLLGQSTTLILTFHYKKREIEEYDFQKLDFGGVKVEEFQDEEYQENNNSMIEKISYRLTPQEAGILQLDDIRVKAQQLSKNYKNFNNRSQYTQNFTLQVKGLKLHVKALPTNVTVVGIYKLKLSSEKIHLKIGEKNRVTLSLIGKGNIDNLDAFTLDIKNAIVKKIYSVKNRSENLQSITYEVVSEEPYIIPSLEINYFDTRQKKVQKLQTNAVKIYVDDYKEIQSEEMSMVEKGVYFLLGLLTALVVFLSYLWYTKKVKKEESEANILKELRLCKTAHALYKKSVPYLQRDKRLDRLIYMLENEKDFDFKALKKELIKKIASLKFL